MSDQPTRFEIQLNGEVHQVETDTTVLDLVNSLPIDPVAVAVERNKRIVPRSLHAETTLEAGDQIEVVTLPNNGKLYSYSIVHRSFPGIEVPYISAIVDLEDGTAIKGNLINCEPDPASIEFDMPVEVVYADALGRKDSDGNSYMSYFFQPKAG